MTASDLCLQTATELTRQIRAGSVSCVEVMEAHLARIQHINPRLNAIVTLVDPDEALRQAAAADRLPAADRPGPLHGLPIAHKDLFPTQGIRTTFGSPIYADHVPTQNNLIVDRLQQAGAITIGKTNTPEFGAGSQTYNEVFGATLNPFDLSKTCGGSSGGAAVALACGMLPIADGSDTGGSLRNPANFCNVVGFRPSPGRVPKWPTIGAWFPIPVEGPLARTVQDVALLMSAIAGPDPRAPISISEPAAVFEQPLSRDFRGVRIAWSRDLGGLPIDPRVTGVLEQQRHVFTDLGAVVEDAEPDFSGADECFRVLRAWWFEASFGGLLREHRHRMKDTLIWNIEEGIALSGPQIGRAEQQRTALYQRVREFLEGYEYLVLPVNLVPPFDVRQPYVKEIGGVAMDSYIDWMKSCYFITVTGLPAISVPCGFTPEGLPVGIQIVGRHQHDFQVLQLAHAFESATECWRQRPSIAVS